MPDTSLQHRLAAREDLDALRELMNVAIGELQKPFLDPAQIASSRTIMGLDTQLIDDGTYFIVTDNGALAGCGGWSRRATLYGGDRSPGRDAALLDPAKDAARVRAMYTHPDFTRRGVGRLILKLCEEAARAEGFTRIELMATMAGEPLYRAGGYLPVERVVDDRGGAGVPLLKMAKAIGQRCCAGEAMTGKGVAVDTLFFPADHSPPLPHEYQFNLEEAAGREALERLTAFLAGLAN